MTMRACDRCEQFYVRVIFSSYPNLSILYYIDDHTLTYFTRSPTITQYPPFARSIRLTPAIRGALRLILRLQ